MIEDAPDGAGLSDERDDEAAVAAGAAAEHVVPEDALHELGFKFVLMGPEDELLGKREFENLKSAVEEAQGIVDFPSSGMGVRFRAGAGRVVLDALAGHISVARSSYAVRKQESELLAAQFPVTPRLDLRRARVLAEGQPEAASVVRDDPEKLASLDHILRTYRNAPVDLSLAAASVFDEPELELCLTWLFSDTGEARDSLQARSFEDLLELFSLDDAGGTLPLSIITLASRIIGEDLDREGNRRWGQQRLLALAHALQGRELAGQVLAQDAPTNQAAGGWGFQIQSEGMLNLWEVRAAGDRLDGTHGVRSLLAAMEADRTSHGEQEAFRRLLRCLEKAARL